jgi:hypothetical protein
MLLPAVVGTGFLFMDFANFWLRSGVAVFMYDMMFLPVVAVASHPWRTPRYSILVARIWGAGYTLAGCRLHQVCCGAPGAVALISNTKKPRLR